ncbi:iron-containing alcohol dehydrogenase [Egibacter rhizosphaerae]|uniref:Iron-containing alcohol dehydrogenase n=1 Tax=Egibacter rhizosphaerae TaxID=1670831 RepID=A0A411YBK5_9ACTN|nr:iron-containing alcohol dehydrogenase [Egibacter rhizosphaerae]QBI18552.1 iron-containing alcohol dehydrogenase [Egibacter rhizosphaerae]
MLETVRSPRQVIVGEGTAEHVPALCVQLGRRVLVVTDRVLVEQPSVQHVLGAVEEVAEHVSVFSEATAEVPLADVDAAVAVAEDARADVVLALGGGSVIDLAKIVACVQTHGGEPADYYGECRVPGPVTPLVAVPTTSGTGSEVSPVSVLTDPNLELKVGVSSPHLVAEFAVADPELTVSCPPSVTAHAGADAFCHCVEAFTARARPRKSKDLVDGVFLGRNDVADDFAVRGVRLIAESLRPAVRDGSDLRARSAMSQAAIWGGLAFSHAGTACPHALQYPLGSATQTPHGLGVGLLLPYVLSAVRDTVADRLAALAGVVGLDAASRSENEAATAFIEWVGELMDDIGIPSSLAELGVAREDVRTLAEKASGVHRLLQNHPGATDGDTLEAILDAAWLGDRERAGVAAR